MRKKESYPHREVQKIVGDVLNKDERRAPEHDVLKSNFRPSTKYGNYEQNIYEPRSLTGTGRVVSFGQ